MLQAVLRCDTVLLLAPVALYLLLAGRLGLAEGIATGFITALASAGSSFLIDSGFWRRPVWPELDVFRFNAVDNRCFGCPLRLWFCRPV